MYLEQAKELKNKWAFFVIPSVFVFSMAKSGKVNIEKNAEVGWEYVFTAQLSSFVVLCVVFMLFFKIVHKGSLKKLISERKKIDWRRIIFGFTLWGGMCIAMTICNFIAKGDMFEWNFNANEFLKLILICSLLLPFQTSFEEIVFRGYFMQAMGCIVKNKWLIVITIAVFFGIMHRLNPEVSKYGLAFLCVYVVYGILYGLIVACDGGIELTLGMHFANNFFSAILVTSSFAVFQIPSILRQTKVEDFTMLSLAKEIAIQAVVFFILYKKYGWKLNNMTE